MVEVEEQFESLDGYKADGPRLFGVASEDIHCRCTTITVVNGISPELRRDNEGNEFPYKIYKEWKQDRIDRFGQKRWDIDVKKDKNKTRDRVQFEQYRKVLGNNFSKNLDSFQELKYNDSKEWLKLQDNYFVKARLKDGRYGSKINPEKQAPHMESTKIDGKSYFYDNVDIQKLFNQYAGTGWIERTESGRRKNTETITIEDVIGVAVSKKGTEVTNTFKIHHSKGRTHIVPVKEWRK